LGRLAPARVADGEGAHPASAELSPGPVRPARPDELALLGEIEVEAGRRFDEVGIELEAAPVAGRGEVPLAVFVAGEPPVGFLWLTLVCGHPHVEEVAVRTEAGRNGLGRALVEAACRWASEAGYERVTLCTFADVPWNGPFYRSAGFEELAPEQWCDELVAVRDQERRNGLDDAGRRVVMVRRLGGAPTSGSRRRGGR
jgi:GNAT superfamily N-acetyltransferase